MKHLLLLGLATILGIGSLATAASAEQDWSRNRERYHQDSKPSPITEPLRYRVERVPEPTTAEVQRNIQIQIVAPNHYSEYRRKHRHIIFRRYHHSTRNDPGRY